METAIGNLKKHVFEIKKKVISKIIRIEYFAHILNNTTHSAIDRIPLDIKSIVLKVFNYFSVYIVRTEVLREFCDFVETEFSLLYHLKTRLS